jgi:hypothetical protein
LQSEEAAGENKEEEHRWQEKRSLTMMSPPVELQGTEILIGVQKSTLEAQGQQKKEADGKRVV